MSANYFDCLEAELRAAVPSATAGRAGSRRMRHWWRSRLGALAVAVSTAVTVGVVLVSVSLLGHEHTQTRPSLHDRGAAPGSSEYPLGAVPTLRQLLDNFAVLRRPQTPRDRSWQPQCCEVNSLTRLATALPSGYQVFLDVEQQLNAGAGSYVLTLDVVDPHGSTSSVSFAPGVGYTVFPLSSGGNDGVFASIVPDGVASVRWTFGCLGGSCAGTRSRTFTVPVVNNVAARQIAGAGDCVPCQVTWRSADGNVVASFNRSWSLVAPPFVKGGRGYRVLRILQPKALGGVRLGESSSTAARTIATLLGPWADAHVPVESCGIDHESVWTSPAVALPLTIFERRGRFAGYQYGAPASQSALVPGPGAVLTTPRGLTVADTVGVARRIYGKRFVTSVAQGGTWRAMDGGTLRGFVMPIIYPFRKVTAANPVANIEAGVTGCPSGGN
jgi:hypothetical protein